MKQEIPTLSINDIVLLKQQPEIYLEKQLETSKTHDGTSSGPIKEHLRIMVGQYSRDAYSHLMVLSSDGKLIDERHMLVANTTISDLTDFEKKDTDMHIVANIGREDGNTGPHYTEGTLNENELKEIMTQNEDGEYLVRSITLVGQDGSSMTVSRMNSFNPENHEEYAQLCKDFVPKISKWAGETRAKPYLEEIQKLTDDFIKENGRQPTYEEEWGENGLHQQAMKKYEGLPTVQEYIIDELGPDFEKCGVKIKYQKNEHIPYYGRDMDSSSERWMSDLYNQKNENYDLWFKYFGE